MNLSKRIGNYLTARRAAKAAPVEVPNETIGWPTIMSTKHFIPEPGAKRVADEPESGSFMNPQRPSPVGATRLSPEVDAEILFNLKKVKYEPYFFHRTKVKRGPGRPRMQRVRNSDRAFMDMHRGKHRSYPRDLVEHRLTSLPRQQTTILAPDHVEAMLRDRRSRSETAPEQREAMREAVIGSRPGWYRKKVAGTAAGFQGRPLITHGIITEPTPGDRVRLIDGITNIPWGEGVVTGVSASVPKPGLKSIMLFTVTRDDGTTFEAAGGELTVIKGDETNDQ